MARSDLAGLPAPSNLLIDTEELAQAYTQRIPDPEHPGQRVIFGTSGHRGTPGNGTFTEAHILAITQAICDYRRQAGINGPLMLGVDTHALSYSARDTALEVLVANEVETHVQPDDLPTPTPVISHAILEYNRGRSEGLADGIVITPSHNPPEDGGFKYNASNGGPADTTVTIPQSNATATTITAVATPAATSAATTTPSCCLHPRPRAFDSQYVGSSAT